MSDETKVEVQTKVVGQIHQIALKDVRVVDRMRKVLGDLTGLADSIRRNGLIQPIVLDRNYNLVAGERRFRSHELLKLETIKFIFEDEAPEEVRKEVVKEKEFEENYWRKSMTWQEEALGILDIYRKRRLAGQLEGWQENYQLTTAQMFGMAIGTLNYILSVAKKLEQEKDPNGPWHSYSSVNEAYRIGILGEVEKKMDSAAAAKHKAVANAMAATTEQAKAVAKVVEEVKLVEESTNAVDALAEVRAKYEANPNKPAGVSFDEYWAEKQRIVEESKNSIFISNRFYHGDCIQFMLDPDNANTYNAIVTDPPFAISMDNLIEDMVDIDKLVHSHEVEENLALLTKFFPAAFACTKELAYVALFCDVENWDFLKKLAIEAGFLVQDWPLIWQKVNQSVKNGAAAFNTTKDFEIVMLCRKPTSTLVNKRTSSIIQGSNVAATKETGHPFAKPYEVTKALFELVSAPGNLVLDPFAGGGSVMIQGLRMDRHMFACEKDEQWYNKLLNNVKTLHYLKINPKYNFK